MFENIWLQWHNTNTIVMLSEYPTTILHEDFQGFHTMNMVQLEISDNSLKNLMQACT